VGNLAQGVPVGECDRVTYNDKSKMMFKRTDANVILCKGKCINWVLIDIVMWFYVLLIKLMGKIKYESGVWIYQLFILSKDIYSSSSKCAFTVKCAFRVYAINILL